MQMWQEQVVEIIRKKFPDDCSSELVKEAIKLLEVPVDPPSGDLGEVIAEIMKQASKNLSPLAGVYLGFQVGVAWERYDNAR